MTNFKVEYLTAVDQKDFFCTSVSSLSNLLRSLDELSISGPLFAEGIAD